MVVGQQITIGKYAVFVANPTENWWGTTAAATAEPL